MINLSDYYYPFEFIGTSRIGSDNYQIDSLIYRFRSSKSAHEYEVHIERYIEHLCCIKFFDTSSVRGFGRFSQLTDTFEPRTIFRTVAHIAIDALNQDSLSSFCFIGASDERDTPDGMSTRRYRVYKAYIRSLDLEDLFEFIFFDQKSFALLVNKKNTTDIDAYAERILSLL